MSTAPRRNAARSASQGKPVSRKRSQPRTLGAAASAKARKPTLTASASPAKPKGTPAALASNLAHDEREISLALGSRIRAARAEKRLTLEQLSKLCSVSRAMLSEVERGEKSPTLPIVVRIATGLGMPLSVLLGAVPSSSEVSVIRAAERLSFRDVETGFERWVLSPTHLDNGLEFVMHRIPPGRSTGTLPPYGVPTEKYISVAEGELTAYVDGRPFVLKAGDSMYFEVRSAYRFVNNDGHVGCTYYMVIARRR